MARKKSGGRKFKLRSQVSRDRFAGKIRLTRSQEKLLRKFGSNARDLAKKMRAEARKTKSRILKERTKIGAKTRGVLVKVGSLNTWTKIEARETARLSVQYIKGGKHKGKFRDVETGKVMTRAQFNRRAGALRYHANVRHMQNVLKGSYAQARKAYKAFMLAGILQAVEFES